MDDGFCVLEVVVDAADDIVDVRFQDMNPSFSRLTGIYDAEGKLASDVVPDLESQWFERYEQVHKTGESVSFVDRVDSLQRWYEVSLSRIGEKAERKLSCLFKDVTERQIHNDERERSTRRLHELATALSESDRRKSEFLATLAHELRNPLAPLLSGLELIAEHPTEPLEIDRARRMMTRQVEQMVHLVDDLLDIARISQGTIFLQPAHTRMTDVVGTAVESSRPLIDAAGHALEVRVPDDSRPLVLDPVRITQVIANLLNNAARYTPPGGHISLVASVDATCVRISVSDDGEGIDEEGLQRIFEMFTRIEGARPREPGGLGIGLTLSRTLVELHGGTLRAYSDGIGRGSRFEIRLPRRTELPVPLDPVATLPSLGPRDGTRRVLVVDDNEDAANALAKLLRIRGFESSVAYDGKSALVAMSTSALDVVFLDIGLPDMTGYEVAARIAGQAWRARVTLVALTGWGAREDRKRSREAGFDHHLTKPVSSHEVLELLSEVAAVREAAPDA